MRDAKKVKILVTGGHVTPAIAVIEEIRRTFPDWEIILVGRSVSLEEERVSSEEMRLARLYKIRFLSISTGRVTRTLSFQTILSVFKIPWGFVQALAVVSREKPTLIASFGGYIALPVVVAGWLFGVPAVTHEQTRVPGLANRLIGTVARKIAISFSDQLGHYPKSKTIYTGLPIRRRLFQKSQRAPRGLETHLPIVFITGGSTGARSMNELIFPLVGALTKKYMIVHQIGSVSFSRAKQIREHLPKSERVRYAIFRYIDMPEYAWILQHAHVVVGRSGANTVGEVATLGNVALWIPLPWSAGDEQRENALYLVRAGTSLIVDQQSLEPSVLVRSIERIESDYETFRIHAETLANVMPRDGAAKVVDIMNQVIRA